MFAYATAFNQNIGNWNTAKVTDMNDMFAYATAFNRDIRRWNTRAVTDMRYMFLGASKMIAKYSRAKGFAATPANAFFNGGGRFPQKKQTDIIKELNETISTDQGELTFTEVQQDIRNGKEPTMNGGLITIKAAIQYTSDNNEQQVLYITSLTNQINKIYGDLVEAKQNGELSNVLEYYINNYNGNDYYPKLIDAIVKSLL